MDALDVRVIQLRKYYQEAVNNPVIRSLAKRITSGARTDLEKVLRIAGWVKKNIRYQKEPPGIDIIVPPLRLINLGVGDCEDHLLLISSLAGAVGIPVKWKVISQDGRVWRHIYPLVRVGGRFRPVDLTVPSLPLFGEVRGFVKARVYSV